LSWYKVNLICYSNDVSLIEEIFLAHEAISISLIDKSRNNPIYEPRVGETPLWDVIELSALFNEKISKKVISSYLDRIPYSNLKIKKLENQNWIKKYQESFVPLKFGERLWVSPTWISEDSDPEGVNLRLDPGMAFGTGSHETTRLCLEYLEKSTLKGLTILDYGCGSGILSIAALMLGANHVIATDIDPQALEATKENSRNNKVIDRIAIVQPSLIPSIKIDLLIANILSNILIDQRDSFSNLLEPRGKLVLSGVMKSQLKKVIDYYERYFTMEDVIYKNNWCLIKFVRS